MKTVLLKSVANDCEGNSWKSKKVVYKVIDKIDTVFKMPRLTKNNIACQVCFSNEDGYTSYYVPTEKWFNEKEENLENDIKSLERKLAKMKKELQETKEMKNEFNTNCFNDELVETMQEERIQLSVKFNKETNQVEIKK